MAAAAEELSESSDDVVTVGLYSKEMPDGSFNRAVFAQIDNLNKIQAKITAAAIKAGKKPPKFVLSLLLVPNWDKPDNSYTHPDYQRTKANLLTEFAEHMQDTTYEIRDFSLDATREELAYMHGLKGNGSNADIIKNHAIIANANVRHLQLDSNTQISNYNDFYRLTFGGAPADAVDINALNASLYDPSVRYVSAHNKVVYTVPPPHGRIATALATRYSAYCKAHADDDADKDADKNSIYSKVFVPALADIGLTRESDYTSETGSKRYLADMSQPEYRITRDVVAAVNMSWAAQQGVDLYAAIKKIKPLVFNDAEIDLACFANLVNVHTSPLLWHEDQGLSVHLLRDILHDKNMDLQILQAYYDYIPLIPGNANLGVAILS